MNPFQRLIGPKSAIETYRKHYADAKAAVDKRDRDLLQLQKDVNDAVSVAQAAFRKDPTRDTYTAPCRCLSSDLSGTQPEPRKRRHSRPSGVEADRGRACPPPPWRRHNASGRSRWPTWGRLVAGKGSSVRA